MNRLDFVAMLKLAAGGLLAALGISVLVAQVDACDREAAEIEDLPPPVIHHTPVPPEPQAIEVDLAMGAGMCDPVTGERGKYTKAQRRETHDRVRAVGRRLGVSRIVLAYMSAIVARESSGRHGVRHTLAEGENGLGAMGLSIRWHRGKWPGKADPDFCVPEVSAVVAHEIFWRAVTRYRARSIADIQAIYGGLWDCDPGGHPCWPARRYRHRAALCERMARRGHGCTQHVSHKDLGRRLRKHERMAFARKARKAYDARNR